MKRIRKLISTFLMICLVLGIVGTIKPTEVQAAAWNPGNGTVNVYNLDNDFQDGMYRFRFKLVYKKNSNSTYDGCGLKFKNIYITNSSGKKVVNYKDCDIILKTGGDHIHNFRVDFSTLPSDTYTLHFSVYSEYSGTCKKYSRSVSHNAGSVKYSSSKYVTGTMGDRELKIVFNILSLKGYKPKLEIYNSSGERICVKNGFVLNSNDVNYYFNWNFYTDDGRKVKSGSYTFKFTVNGKSASKKLNITVK